MIRQVSKGKSELIVPPDGIKDIFPDWGQINRTAELQAALIKDGAHQKTKRQIDAKGKKRVYCFRMPKAA